MSAESTSTCEKCGATIYREHIDAGIARYEAGKLLCPHCVEEYESMHDSAGGRGTGADEVLDPIAMEEDEGERQSSETQITAFGGVAMGGGQWTDDKWMRPLDPKSPYASRCRTFHCKLSDGAVSFLNGQINDWLDANPNISVKFANSVIGIFEGKHPEPNLIVTVFY